MANDSWCLGQVINLLSGSTHVTIPFSLSASLKGM